MLASWGVVVAILLRQYGRSTHYQILYKAEATLRDSLELQAVTLGSIGDAVIAVDVRGRVTLFHAAAEGLTEVSGEPGLRGRPSWKSPRRGRRSRRGGVSEGMGLARGRGAGAGDFF